MEIKQVMALVNAGYTKADIDKMETSILGSQMQTQFTQPNQMQTQFAQPNQMQTQFAQPNQMQTQFAQPNQMQTQFAQPNQMQTQFTQTNQMQNIDYKTLYETQKKMLEDMQTLNLTGAKGAPIDTPLSVVNDFLGGEK